MSDGCRYGRADVLCGLINGAFLVFIALFILKEALEVRLSTLFPSIHKSETLDSI